MGQTVIKELNREGLIDLILTNKEIVSRAIPSHELFMLFHGGEYFGPLCKDDLQAINQMDPFFFEKYKLKIFNEKEKHNLGHWINFYEHPLFQRRKPELVLENMSQELAEKSKYFILKNGQSLGPYSYEELKHEILHKSLYYTDLFRSNEEDDWDKIYKIPGFDRRATLPGMDEEEELPDAPDVDLIKKSAEEVSQILDANKLLEDQNRNSLANLMALSTERAKKFLAVSRTQISNSSNVLSNKKYRYWAIGLISIVALGIVAFLFTDEIKKQFDMAEVNKQKKSKATKIDKSSKNDTLAKDNSIEEMDEQEKLESDSKRQEAIEKRLQARIDKEQRRKERQRNREQKRLGERDNYDAATYDDYVPSDEYYYDDDVPELEGEATSNPRRPASRANKRSNSSTGTEREEKSRAEDEYYEDQDENSSYDGVAEEPELFDEELPPLEEEENY
ncbi:MAG: DUF4339 domain-containing protein [Halobacteriovoraceae bacterium]|nr:DUF4339 domain-containing protein [Halobacteriovoraceae bacterium]